MPISSHRFLCRTLELKRMQILSYYGLFSTLQMKITKIAFVKYNQEAEPMRNEEGLCIAADIGTKYNLSKVEICLSIKKHCNLDTLCNFGVRSGYKMV